VRHRASPKFWDCHERLPEGVQKLAGENFQLLKRNPRRSSLYFKGWADFGPARVGLHYRVLAVEQGGDLVWFWIGHHTKYERLLKSQI